MADGIVSIGTLGPYAGENWSEVCKDGLAWFGAVHQIPIDIAVMSDVYSDEYGMPAAYATTYAQVQTEVVVRKKVQTWRVRAYAKRVRDNSKYFFLERITVHDVTREDSQPFHLCTYKFELDELDTTRSQIVSITGRILSHQLPIGVS